MEKNYEKEQMNKIKYRLVQVQEKSITKTNRRHREFEIDRRYMRNEKN